MLTGRRIRERQAAEAAGLPPPPPPNPTSIPYQEHLAELGRVNKAHAVELAAARAKAPAGKGGKAQLESLTAELAETTGKLKEALELLEKTTTERDALLDKAASQSATGDEAGKTGKPSRGAPR